MKRFISQGNFQSYRQKLRQWFEQNGRDLPFRKSRDPYQIWLSEIIMQQTRMEQGLPYFSRFINTYPQVDDLARADEDEVLKMWEGLGYYSRARNLLHAAKQIAEEFDGIFPDNYRELLRMKGVGAYTAAAIASIAFDEAVAVVDGNVQRVLSRIFAISTPVNTSEGSKLIQKLAGEFLDSNHPGLHNEALMELGALVCTPKQPSCMLCPLQFGCQAFQLNRIVDYPVKKPKSDVKKLHLLYLVLQFDDHILIRKRTQPGIWHQLYEAPGIELNDAPSPEAIHLHITAALKHWKLNLKKAELKNLLHFSHQLTHRAISAHFAHIRTEQPETLHPDLILANESQLVQNFALTRLFSRFLETANIWRPHFNASNKKNR